MLGYQLNAVLIIQQFTNFTMSDTDKFYERAAFGRLYFYEPKYSAEEIEIRRAEGDISMSRSAYSHTTGN